MSFPDPNARQQRCRVPPRCHSDRVSRPRPAALGAALGSRRQETGSLALGSGRSRRARFRAAPRPERRPGPSRPPPRIEGGSPASSPVSGATPDWVPGYGDGGLRRARRPHPRRPRCGRGSPGARSLRPPGSRSRRGVLSVCPEMRGARGRGRRRPRLPVGVCTGRGRHRVLPEGRLRPPGHEFPAPPTGSETGGARAVFAAAQILGTGGKDGARRRPHHPVGTTSSGPAIPHHSHPPKMAPVLIHLRINERSPAPGQSSLVHPNPQPALLRGSGGGVWCLGIPLVGQ